MINRKIPWTIQPQVPVGIDWSNPLANGLLLANCASLVGNQVNNSPPTRRTASVSHTGLEPNYFHANGEVVFSTPGIKTFFGRYLFDPTNERFGGMFSTTNRSGIYFEYKSSQLKAVVFNNGSWPVTNIGATPATGELITLAVVSDSDTSHRIYRNGLLVATLSNTAQTGTFNVAGAMYCDASTFYTAKVAGVSGLTGFSRRLSGDEIKELHKSQFGIFSPLNRRIWVASAGGTNTAVNPGTGSIAITGYAPSIAQTANQAITPNVGNIVITGYAPTISQPQAVNPGVGSLTITGYAPTVTQNVDVPVNPGVGTIAITGYAPTVAQTANQSVLPATGTIAITGYSPTVSQSANQAVTPDVGTITITGYAPIVQQAPASQNITPDVGTITITGYAPTVEQSSPLRLGGFEYGSKVYIKRNKKIYIFDSVEEADSYLEAEAKVEEIVQQSNRTSRLARKRAREKAFKSLAIEPVESVDIPALKTLVSQLQTGFELPKLIAQQDWQRVVEIYNQAMEMQDEEDLLLIL